MKLTIHNKTRWSSRDVGKLIRAVARLEVPEADSWSYYHVYIRYGQPGGRGVRGRAAYGGRWMTLLMPRPFQRVSIWNEREIIPDEASAFSRSDYAIKEARTYDPIDLAHTIAHEFAHSKGLRHRDMKVARYSYIDGWREYYAWAGNYLIRHLPDRKETSSLRTLPIGKKLDRARIVLFRHERRVARAAKLVKKWKFKVRYYERKLAAQVGQTQAKDGQNG